MRRLAAAAVLLAASAGRAAPYDGAPVDAWQGALLGDARAIGLGGALAGVAEGLGATPSNPAAIAQRRPDLDRPWDVGGSLTWFAPPPADLGRLDLGNDGRPDSALAGRSNVQGGVSGQAGRLGAGILARTYALQVARGGGEAVNLRTEQVSLALGWTGLRDQLAIGASIEAAAGVVERTVAGAVVDKLEYDASAVRLGALVRPRGLPFRVGAAFQPAMRGTPRTVRGAFPGAAPSAFSFPWVAVVGASAWIGPNAARYNEPPPVALRQHPDWGEGAPYERGERDPVLVAVQLDVVGPTPGAVGMDGAFAGGDALASGKRPGVVPRAGAEWEAIDRWLRVRGGSYVEPSRTGALARTHATFGGEVRIPCWPWDLQLALTGDLARQYQNVSLSIGFWSAYGPAAPPDAGAVAANSHGR